MERHTRGGIWGIDWLTHYQLTLHDDSNRARRVTHAHHGLACMLGHQICLLDQRTAVMRAQLLQWTATSE